MAKTTEELEVLKQECEALSNKLCELSDDELMQVTGGSGVADFFKKMGEALKNITKPVAKVNIRTADALGKFEMPSGVETDIK